MEFVGDDFYKRKVRGSARWGTGGPFLIWDWGHGAWARGLLSEARVCAVAGPCLRSRCQGKHCLLWSRWQGKGRAGLLTRLLVSRHVTLSP